MSIVKTQCLIAGIKTTGYLTNKTVFSLTKCPKRLAVIGGGAIGCVNTIKIDLKNVERAIADGEESGLIKIHHLKGKDEILGETIVARHAGEMISEITTAIVNQVGLNGLSSVIHPYPTQAEAIKKAADTYRRTLLTPRTNTISHDLAR